MNTNEIDDNSYHLTFPEAMIDQHEKTYDQIEIRSIHLFCSLFRWISMRVRHLTIEYCSLTMENITI